MLLYPATRPRVTTVRTSPIAEDALPPSTATTTPTASTVVALFASASAKSPSDFVYTQSPGVMLAASAVPLTVSDGISGRMSAAVNEISVIAPPPVS